jgi:membrane protease YdiL (CAAX protease family)
LSSRAASRLALAGAGIYGAVLAAALVAGGVWPRAAVPWNGADPAGAAGWGLATGLGVVAATRLLVGRLAAVRRLVRTLAGAVAGMRVPEALLLAVSAGVAEEAVFRGTLWSLAASAWGDGVALVVTSLAFGAVHGLFVRRLRAWGLFALAAGLLLGGLRWHTGGILAPVLAHVAIDAVNLPWLARRALDATDEPMTEAGGAGPSAG